MQDFLEATVVVDYNDPAIRSLAADLASNEQSQEPLAARCFYWVRDRIRHSGDCHDEVVTLAASEVLRAGTGLCYAKSHLLAALLRANGIPCGFVYQRLAADENHTSHCLHGLNAVWLPQVGWYRVDARGDKAGITTEFAPPLERLAFRPSAAGECTFETVFPRPLPVVVEALRTYKSLTRLSKHLPDWNADQAT